PGESRGRSSPESAKGFHTWYEDRYTPWSGNHVLLGIQPVTHHPSRERVPWSASWTTPIHLPTHRCRDRSPAGRVTARSGTVSTVAVTAASPSPCARRSC